MENYDRPHIFDGHNDVLLKLHNAGGVSAAGRFVTGDTNAP